MEIYAVIGNEKIEIDAVGYVEREDDWKIPGARKVAKWKKHLESALTSPYLSADDIIPVCNSMYNDMNPINAVAVAVDRDTFVAATGPGNRVEIRKGPKGWANPAGTFGESVVSTMNVFLESFDATLDSIDDETFYILTEELMKVVANPSRFGYILVADGR